MVWILPQTVPLYGVTETTHEDSPAGMACGPPARDLPRHNSGIQWKEE